MENDATTDKVEDEKSEAEESEAEKTTSRKRRLSLRLKKVDAKKRKGRAKKKTRLSSGDETSEGSDLDWANPGASKKQPGQFANCEICEQRFTVTAYSKTGPNGGLVCNPCGKELGADAAASKKKATRATAAKRKRNLQSERLDGIVRRGAKPLVQLCIETVLKYHDSIESFDNVPDHLMSRICRLFCKHRVLNSQSLPLFIRADMTVIEIFDCACKVLRRLPESRSYMPQTLKPRTTTFCSDLLNDSKRLRCTTHTNSRTKT
jgi:DNA repair protein RAD7